MGLSTQWKFLDIYIKYPLDNLLKGEDYSSFVGEIINYIDLNKIPIDCTDVIENYMIKNNIKFQYNVSLPISIKNLNIERFYAISDDIKNKIFKKVTKIRYSYRFLSPDYLTLLIILKQVGFIPKIKNILNIATYMRYAVLYLFPEIENHKELSEKTIWNDKIGNEYVAFRLLFLLDYLENFTTKACDKVPVSIQNFLTFHRSDVLEKDNIQKFNIFMRDHEKNNCSCSFSSYCPYSGNYSVSTKFISELPNELKYQLFEYATKPIKNDIIEMLLYCASDSFLLNKTCENIAINSIKNVKNNIEKYWILIYIYYHLIPMLFLLQHLSMVIFTKKFSATQTINNKKMQ